MKCEEEKVLNFAQHQQENLEKNPSSDSIENSLKRVSVLAFAEAQRLQSRSDERRSRPASIPFVMTMNKRKLIMESNKHMLNYIEVVPGKCSLHKSYQTFKWNSLGSRFVGQLVFVTFKKDVKPISNKHRTYIRVDTFLHYEGEGL